MKSGNVNFLEPSGPLQACNGTALSLPLPLLYKTLYILNIFLVRKYCNFNVKGSCAVAVPQLGIDMERGSADLFKLRNVSYLEKDCGSSGLVDNKRQFLKFRKPFFLDYFYRCTVHFEDSLSITPTNALL